MDITQRAIAAAWFFNGEGHVGSSVGKTRKWARRDLYLTLSQTDRWVLDKFQEFVGGVGRVTGPFVRSYRNPNERDVYYFQLHRFEYVQATIALMWPWLSPIKKAQATSALLAMRERGNHQQTCRNGHPRTSDNLVMFGPANRWRGCRSCQRENARAQESNRQRQRLLHRAQRLPIEAYDAVVASYAVV